MKSLFYFIIYFFLLIGCSNVSSSIDKKKPQLEEIFFDVVEKKLILDDKLPNNIKNLASYWYDNKVKTSGFEGKITFEVYGYQETITSIDNGKKADVSVKFVAKIENSTLSKRKTIRGDVNAYGLITGDFSMNDFDVIIKNAQADLIIILSRDLKSKI